MLPASPEPKPHASGGSTQRAIVPPRGTAFEGTAVTPPAPTAATGAAPAGARTPQSLALPTTQH